MKFQLFKTGSPTDAIQCQLYSDSSGEPGTLIDTASNTVSGAGLTGTKEIHTFLFDAGNFLNVSNGYWLVLSRTGSQDVSNYYNVRAYGI